MEPTVTVRHAVGSYPVLVKPGLLERLQDFRAKHLPERRCAMIADAAVYAFYSAGRFGAVTWTGDTLCVPPGESSKSREAWAQLSDELLGRQFGRDSGLIGLGGGVTGDLTGFVAATYMRGIPYILVPTTLLAMVDAAVGGKTAVNTPMGKNLIGAFHPPAAVIADPLTLETLPEREYRSGLSEAVKHGLIADRNYFEWMEAETASILRRQPEAVSHLVHRSVQIKADVVSADERESGQRAMLNAGHTVAHALEQLSGYQLLHGEAVALGLVAECEVAERLGVAPAGLGRRVAGLLERFGLPTRLEPSVDIADAVQQMGSDKKNRAAEIHCALPADIGRMHHQRGWTVPVSPEHVVASLVKMQEPGGERHPGP
ncbi:MAG TPA: 3-dehydroquinate synthase [Gemmatimonadales bacterium]|nr:3-dehydroquinate synthase [Gemmatimonadales bacterium]